jgi:hypothetical protein
MLSLFCYINFASLFCYDAESNKARFRILVCNSHRKSDDCKPLFSIQYEVPSNRCSQELYFDRHQHIQERYNKFLFDEGATDAKTLEVGEHEYRIYAQISSNNLNPTLADELVETGILKVIPLLNEELFYQVS